MDTLNFCFPLPERSVENDRVKLDPFTPSKHADLVVNQAMLYPEIFHYIPFGPLKSPDDFMKDYYDPYVRNDIRYTKLFAIIDKTKRKTNPNKSSDDTQDTVAGLIGLINSSPINLATEIGPVIVFPPFQGTHISSNATGLLLEYTLNLPSASPPGLGLRRVVWQTNALNKPSMGLAERMGFKLEGILRWERTLPPGKEETGRMSREGDPRRDLVGRDTALFAFCWDDWEDGGREKVNLIMQRVK